MSEMTNFTTLPTYNNLINALQVYLNRYDEDTKNAMAFFINAAEKTILRNLRMPAMEKIVSFKLAEVAEEEGSCWLPMPYDYLEMKHVWIEGRNATTLQRVPFDQLIQKQVEFMPRGHAIYREITRPVWAITADRLYINGVPGDVDIFMTYYADIEEVSVDTQSNILLELVPDAFLYLSVGEGFRFLMEEEKADYWQKLGMQRLQQVMAQVEEAEFSGSPLTIQYTY